MAEQTQTVLRTLTDIEYLGDSISAGLDRYRCLHIVKERSDGTCTQVALDPEVFGNLLSYLMAMQPRKLGENW